MSKNKTHEYREILNKIKFENEVAAAVAKETLIINNPDILNLEVSFNKSQDDEKKEAGLSPINSNTQTNENMEDEKDNKEPIFLTTWEDTRTGKLLAYSVGFGQMGSKVHDVSHLNISRGEFMAKAVPTILNGSSPKYIEDALEKDFPSQKTYSSFSEYQQHLEADNEPLPSLSI